jgi:hypothetical protein
MPTNSVRSLALGFALWAAGMAPAVAADRLPALGADPAASSASGLSSGAFMAAQFHVAFSASLIGAGVVAGGPFACAEGSAQLALHRCMDTSSGPPDAARLLDIAARAAARGAIDDPSNLRRARLYIFGGSNDRTVAPPVVDSLVAFYRGAGVPDANVQVRRDIAAGHAFIVAEAANPCSITAPPFINDCGYDQAGAILRHIYGPLRQPSAAPQGRLVTFDQSEFLAEARAHGLDDAGFVYIPQACEAAGAGCRVHVAFHGCQQGREVLRELYATRTGYNRWADTNGLVILYPQAVRTPANPRDCWDWFAYDDAAYYTKAGRQMAAVKAMLDRLLQSRARG